MKIAQVCPYDFSRPGGVKSHIISLSKYLTKLGHQVKIIAPNINGKLIDTPNVYLFGKNRSLNLGGTKIDLNLALKDEKVSLKKFLKEEGFDIIHYHTIWNPLLPYQVLKYGRAKHVATFHDTPKNKFVGDWIMPLVARWIFPFLNEIISVSKSQAKFINRLSKRAIHIIPNGIDLELVSKYEGSTEQSGFFQLFFLGRLEPRKGVFQTLEAYRILKLKYPKCKLIIAGDGDQREAVEKFIKDYSLADVELWGFVDEETKYQLLKSSDVYVASALFGESFGVVLLEAMAMGTSIAGFANEGYKNVLTEEMLSHFSEPGDVSGLARNIEKLILSEKRKRLATHGLAEVKKYDWKVITKAIEEVYESK